MALALYRKYRPATFAEVMGQEHVTEPLRTALAAGRINHAYLFSGPRGCGKTSSARILARSLNCERGPTPDPCGVCGSCIALAPEGPGSLDVVELDAASHGGVDDTRELRDRAFYMPAESRFRVFIIDEAHMVTTQGFNALLKIVEEPPEHLVFVFATTEPDKVLPTIRSRTHHYPFRLMPPTVMRRLLEDLCIAEGVQVEPAVYPLVIAAGGGSARDSLSVLDQLLAGAGPDGVTYPHAVALLGVTDAVLLDEMVSALAAGDGSSVFLAIDRVVEAGHDPRRFAADLLHRLRDLVILAAVPDAADKGLIDAPSDQLAVMVSQAGQFGVAGLSRMADVLHTGLVEMRGTTAPRLVLELVCARMLLPSASGSEDAVLQRLERLERGVPAAGAGGGRGGATPGPEPAVPASTRLEAARADSKPESPSVAATAPVARRSSPPARSASGGTAPAPAVPAAPDLGLPPPPVRRSAVTADQRPASPASPSAAAPPVAASVTPEQAAAPAPPVAPAASETTAEPESPAPAGTGITAADVRRVWPEVLAAAREQRRTTQVLLESATVAALEGSVLMLTMPSSALARRVMESSNLDVLRAALRNVLKVDWAVRAEAVGPASFAAAQGTTPIEMIPPAGGAGRPRGRPAGSAVEDDVPPPIDEDIPDDYGDEPAAGSAAVRDPEEVAIELLSSQLGARRIEAEQ